MRRPDSGLVALTVGMLGSGAANVTWAWAAGPVHVAAGVFATALVPTSLHLWPRVPITGGKSRAIRAVVMSYICAAAAAVNLIHATLLLTGYVPTRQIVVESVVVEIPVGMPVWFDVLTAVLLITAVEAVMVMASLARRARPAVLDSRKASDTASDTNRRPKSSPTRSGGGLPSQSTPPAAAAATEPDQLTKERVKRIMAEEGVSERTAYRRLEKQRAAS